MEITEKLKESIMNRCNESITGRIIVPTDILNKYIKETGKENEDRFLVKSEIIEIATAGNYGQ